MTKGFTLRLIPALMMFGFASVAGASGFAVQNQNGAGTGNAFAGAAAVAEDASTIYFNPAGMTYLQEGHSISAAGTLLNRSVKFSDNGSSAAAGVLGTTNGGDAGGLSVIPAGYYSYSISPALRVGLGISPTFGNKTEYTKDFIGRSAGIMSEWEQININPSVAYRVSDALSLGAGLNYATLDLHIQQGIPTSATNYADIKGSAHGWGYNVGLMWQVSPSTRIGAAYRSTIKFKSENGTFRRTDATGEYDFTTRLKTPDNFSLSVTQKLSDKWEMLGDITWTGWSSIQDIDLIRKDTGAVGSTLSYKFRDTWRAGIGANYKYNDAWKLRFGFAYDRTPVTSPENRTMTVPDADRIWLSFGAKYQLSKASSLDFGYAHIFFRDVTTNRQVQPAAVGQVIRGNFKTSADILSVQYNHTF